MALVRGPGHTEHPPEDHRAPRHRGLVHRGQRPRAVADRGRLLGRRPDDEARLVDEVDDGQVERVGQIDEAGDLLAGLGRPAAAVHVGVAGEDGDGPAVEPGQTGHGRATPAAPDLREGVAVDERVDDRPDLVDLPPVAGDRVDQPVVAALRIVALGLRRARRCVEHRRRQIREEASRQRERVLFVGDDIVDDTVAAVDGAAAETLLVDLLAEPGDDRRSRDEHLRRALHHHREVAAHDARRAESGHRAERERDDGNGREVGDDVVPSGVERDVGAAHGVE